MGFEQAEGKRCGGCLKVVNWGWRCNSQKKGRDSFHWEGRFSLCNTVVLWNIITGYILQKILWDISFHYTSVVLHVWVLQSQKCNSKCPNDINTEWVIVVKFLSFLLYSWKLHILNPPHPLLPLFVFFYYSVGTIISDCNHPFDTSTFTHTVSQEYIYCNWKYISEWSFFEIKNLYFSIKEITILKS